MEDVACRVIAAHQQPDHATIARFVVRHERALGELFGEVLALCADAGLATVGVVAIDGTKVTPTPTVTGRWTTSRSRARSSRRRSRPTPPRPPCTASGAGTSCREIVATAEGRQGWLRARASGSISGARERAQPIPRSRPERLKEAKRGWRKSSAVERDANEQLRGLRAARRDGATVAGSAAPPEALHAARRTRAARSTSPTRTPGWCTACAAGSRATTPRPSATSST